MIMIGCGNEYNLADYDSERKTMTDKYTMSAQEIESINSDLFNSFDPDQELWIIGANYMISSTMLSTYSAGHYDTASDFDIVW
jgi:hypothetical protein